MNARAATGLAGAVNVREASVCESAPDAGRETVLPLATPDSPSTVRAGDAALGLNNNGAPGQLAVRADGTPSLEDAHVAAFGGAQRMRLLSAWSEAERAADPIFAAIKSHAVLARTQWKSYDVIQLAGRDPATWTWDQIRDAVLFVLPRPNDPVEPDSRYRDRNSGTDTRNPLITKLGQALAAKTAPQDQLSVAQTLSYIFGKIDPKQANRGYGDIPTLVFQACVEVLNKRTDVYSAEVLRLHIFEHAEHLAGMSKFLPSVTALAKNPFANPLFRESLAHGREVHNVLWCLERRVGDLEALQVLRNHLEATRGEWQIGHAYDQSLADKQTGLAALFDRAAEGKEPHARTTVEWVMDTCEATLSGAGKVDTDTRDRLLKVISFGCQALGDHRSDATRALAERMLAHDDFNVRRTALAALAGDRSEAAKALFELAKQDPDEGVQRTAASTQAALDPKPPAAVAKTEVRGVARLFAWMRRS